MERVRVVGDSRCAYGDVLFSHEDRVPWVIESAKNGVLTIFVAAIISDTILATGITKTRFESFSITCYTINTFN